jgi:hypothetical protein
LGHNLQALGSADLSNMGGLITFADPKDLPEGASPRNWDVDYAVGAVFTRPGLTSVYSFTSTLIITGFSLHYGLAVFTYTGITPTVNEEFILSGFTDGLSFLNGQTVFVLSVTPTTFTANVIGSDITIVSGIFGNAVSLSGIFVGPNIGSLATGPSWNSPNNIFSSTGYASVATGVPSVVSVIPGSAVNSGTGTPWTTPGNITATGASVATVFSSSFFNAPHPDNIQTSAINLNIPSNVIVKGISISLAAQYSGSGTGNVILGLTSSGSPISTTLSFPVTSTMTTYIKGSSTYQWGTVLTPALVNGPNFGVTVTAGAVGSGANGTFSANSLVVTVYYATSTTSGVLLDQAFSFSLALTSGISGFGVSFLAYSSTTTSASLQLLQAGVPVGTPKIVQLTTTPGTVYSLGGPMDLWGSLWSAANVNSTLFGVQIEALGTGTTFIGDLDVITYITPALANFNYIGSYEQNNLFLQTLALDENGNLWKEDVTNTPGVLSLALTGLLPDTFAHGETMNNKEFLMFSDLTIGTDRPRLLDTDGNFYPVTQVGPGAPPAFQAAIGSVGGIIQLTSFAITSNVITFQYTGPQPSADAVYVLNIPSIAYLNGQAVIVLSSGLTPTQFEAAFQHPDVVSTPITGTATPSFSYGIVSITQFPPYSSTHPTPAGLGFLLSSAPGSQTPGNNVTVYYSVHSDPNPTDANLAAAMASGNAVFVEITGAVQGGFNFNGIWQVTSMGQGFYPGTSETLAFFTFTFTTTGHYPGVGIVGSQYRQTLATLTTSTPIPGLTAGSPITITGVTPSGWNNTWTIVEALNGGAYNITSTGFNYSTNTATYGWNFAGTTTTPPTVGNIVTIINCTNNAVFNGTFVIATVSGSFFTVTGIAAPPGILPGQTVETQGQATEFGTEFTFDPGEKFQGTTTNVIFGNGSGGNVAIIGGSQGSSIVPIGAGTRQAIVFFITESGNWTPASPPITFTVSSNANLLNVSSIPIGPPDVVARGIAITEAGQNGVPGANFYVIENPVVITIGTVTTTYTSTIIRNNIDTTAAFSFTDAVLLNSTEIDIQGRNLFNLIELGSPAWSVAYSSRMFYGMMLNKVDNFNNLSFDGGYLPNPTGTILPLGWGIHATNNEITLLTSPVTGQALYISNTTGSIQPVMGTITQTAFQDPYKVQIIRPNTLYSVRVACACLSGIRLGTLVIDLVDLSGGIFGNTYGSFSVPLTSMTTISSVFSGTLLIAPFANLKSLPATLVLRLRVINMGIGADVLVDRIEVFPTKFPFIRAQVYGSYIGKPESIDTSGDGGILDTSIQNAQTCTGAFILRDSLYLTKTSSLYITKDNPNSEPGGWSINEVSNRVGAIGIASYDTGEEWAIMACRNGIWATDGGQPKLFSLEIEQLYNAINWDAGNTIVLRNDIINRRILCAVPLPTGTDPVTGQATKTVQWLPHAPFNPKPTTPNVILMLNYEALGSFEELMSAIQVHATMFGTLASPDMRRKWSIWQIPTPYMGFVTRQNLNDVPLFICNGIDSSKIYQLDPMQRSDDGVAIYSLYTTYGFVNAAKSVTMPIFGMHQKRYTVLQLTAEGNGALLTKMYPNTLDARYPYTVPIGINLNNPVQDDYMRSINVKGNRAFIEVSTNAVGSWFELHKILLTGKQDAWSSISPTGGGNAGIV